MRSITKIAENTSPPTGRVLLISLEAPAYGGLAVQAQLLRERLEQEDVPVAFLSSNLAFPTHLRFIERIRGVRVILGSALFSWRLWRMLGGVDVVHVLACSWLYFFAVVCPTVLLSRIRGRRVVLNYHGGRADDFLRRYGPVVKPFFRMADTVTAPSGFLVDVIRNRTGVDVDIVPNIVDFGRFRYRQRTPLRPRMLVTRHLEKLYDIECVIRAFSEVQKHYSDACLWIAGSGKEENRLRGLVSTEGLKNIEFLGYVPYRDLPAVYDQCDILLNASRADNFPVSLVEGAAAGLVVISTNAGGIPYIFENDKSALLVDIGDSAGLAAEILRVLTDPQLATELTAEAVRQCRRYEWESIRGLLYRSYGWFDERPYTELPAVTSSACE